jgi:BirA family transcriptional regulator, biotin operon repressor / biotin---[acetyl-CoA-carboxylase] ligase
MQHIHLNEINSTQDYLKKLLQQRLGDQNSNILVTTDQQTQGVGRRDRQWIDHHGCLTMSFTMSPNPIVTLTTLEVSILIAEFFKEKFNLELKLKWPNDLFFLNKKVGGCLIDQIQNLMVVGIGINLNYAKNLGDDFSHLGLLIQDKTLIAKQIYQFICDQRMSEDAVKQKWISCCAHLQAMVSCQDQTQIIQGKFIGIGHYGEALIATDEGIQKVYSATLRF